MYSIAVSTLAKNYPIFLITAVALEVIDTYGLTASAAVSILIYCMLALFSHRIVLLQEDYGWKGMFETQAIGGHVPFWAFGWRYLIFSIIFIAFAIYLIVFTADLFGNSQDAELIALLLGALLATPVFGLVLALFGTALPAAAIGGNPTFGAAFSRGRSGFVKTLIRLGCGPLAFSAVSVLFVLGVLTRLENMDRTIDFFVGVLAHFLGLIPTHLTAIVLSLAYMEAEGIDHGILD